MGKTEALESDKLGCSPSSAASRVCSLDKCSTFSPASSSVDMELTRQLGGLKEQWVLRIWSQAQHRACILFFLGPPLEEAPTVLDKPDVVYVVEGQPASVTVTFNHVEAQIVWRRWDPAFHAPLPTSGNAAPAILARPPCGIWGEVRVMCPLAAEGPS